MADVNVKTLQTRIALKYDTYANWTDGTKEGQGANLVLLKGELGICAIENKSEGAQTAPTVLFKVGDGVTPFKTLKWASALAADVYAWAKASDVILEGKVIKFVGTDKTITLNYATPDEVAAAVKVVSDDLSDVDSRVTALESKFTGTSSVQGQIDALDGRLDVIEGADTVDGSIAKALKDAKAYTDARELVINAYADQAEADAVSTAKGYTDTEVTKVSDKADGIAADLAAHEAKSDNPHKVTKEQVGLGNVDNKSVDTIRTEFTGEIAENDDGFVTGGDVHTAITGAKTYAKDYADNLNTAIDTRVSDLEAAKLVQDTTNTNLAQSVTNALSEAKTHADSKASAAQTAAETTAKSYTDAREVEINKYADQAEADAVATAKSYTDAEVKKLSEGAIATNASEISRVDGLVTAEKTARENADSGLNTRLEKVEAFFEGAYTEDGQPVKDALDTLVEIQNYITGEGEAASDLLDSIKANADAIDALEATLAEGGDFEKRVAAVEAAATENAGDITALENITSGFEGAGAIQTAITDAINEVKGYADTAEADAVSTAKSYTDTREVEINKYVDQAELDAVATAKNYTDKEVETLEAADLALQANIDKKLTTEDFNSWKNTHTADHAKTATEITSEITTAVSGEKSRAEAAEKAINDTIGASTDGKTATTVYGAIAGVKETAEGAASDITALTSRVDTAEGEIDAIQAIVSAGDNTNAKLRSDITELQGIVKNGADNNAALGLEIDSLANKVDNETTGLAATKGIADAAKKAAENNASDIADIKADYLKQADIFIFDCGSATEVIHVAPANN